MAENTPPTTKNQTHLLEIERLLKGAHGQSLVATEIKNDELFADVAPVAVPDVMRWLRDDRSCRFDYIRCLCGVDYSDHVTVVYHLFATKTKSKITVRVEVSKESPAIASVTDVWAGADWLERETAEMFGLVFDGHPDPRRLLLTEDNDAMPLRKDFKLDYGNEQSKVKRDNA